MRRSAKIKTLRNILKGGAVSSQALIYVGAAALNAVIPFLLLPFIARWLGPSDFGAVGSFVALVSILVPFIGLNAYGLISVVYFSETEDKARQQTSSAVVIVLAMTALLGLLSLFFRGPLAGLAEFDAAWVWTIVIAAFGQGLITIALTVAQTTRRAFIYGCIQVGYALLLFVACLVLIGALGFGWEGRLLAQVLAALVVAGLGLRWLMLRGHLSWPLNMDNIRSSLRFGLPLLPHSLGAVVMLSTDRLVLANAGGSAQVGFYYLGFQIASLLLLLGTALNQAWLPWLYARLARNGAAEQREIRMALLGIGAFLVVAALGIVLLAPWLVWMAGGAHFETSIGPLRLLAPAMACQAWYLFVSGFLFYHGRTGLLSIITCSVAGLQLGLMALLSRYGMMGVASGVLITGVVYAAATTFAGLRVHPLDQPPQIGQDESAA